jgi:uncharacterized protein YdiU (UPF0061 family)
MPLEDLQLELANFNDYYYSYYRCFMLRKLGFKQIDADLGSQLVVESINLLKDSQYSYHQFFIDLTTQFNHGWQLDDRTILENSELNSAHKETWQKLYHQALAPMSVEDLEQVQNTLDEYNPSIIPVRPIIEAIWEPITIEDNWQPFYDLLEQIKR